MTRRTVALWTQDAVTLAASEARRNGGTVGALVGAAFRFELNVWEYIAAKRRVIAC